MLWFEWPVELLCSRFQFSSLNLFLCSGRKTNIQKMFFYLIVFFLLFQNVTFTLFLFFYQLWMIVIIMPFASFGMSLVAVVADSLLTALVAENEQVSCGFSYVFFSFRRRLGCGTRSCNFFQLLCAYFCSHDLRIRTGKFWLFLLCFDGIIIHGIWLCCYPALPSTREFA